MWSRRVDELTAALAQVERQQSDPDRWRERHRQDLDRLQVLERALQSSPAEPHRRFPRAVDLPDAVAL